MKLVGLTGGIGSGKSLTANIFKLLRVPVYDTDQRAKYLMSTEEKLKLKIQDLFGIESYFQDGKLNTAYIATKVFSNPKELATLNALVHPYVGYDINDWAHSQEANFGLIESALIQETARLVHLDKIITVIAPESLRVQRIMNRNGISKQDALLRIKQQLDDAVFTQLADYILYNDGKQSIIRQCCKLYQVLNATLHP